MAILPILILTGGAMVIGLARKRTVRFGWSIAVGTAGLAWLVSLVISARAPLQTNISVWRPIDLFGAQIELRLDEVSAPAVIAGTTVLLAVVLSSAIQLSDRNFRLKPLTLIYGALGLAAMLSADLLTAALSWALMDLVTLLYGIGIAKDDVAISSLLARAIVNACGIFAVIGTAIVNESAGGSVDLAVPLASQGAIAIFIIAAVLRLGWVRLDYGLAELPGIDRAYAALVGVLPPAAALTILARQFAHGIPQELAAWLRVACAVGLLISGARWLLDKESTDRMRFFIIGMSFLGIMASTTVSVEFEAPLLSAIVILLIVGSTCALGRVFSPWHRAFPVLAAAIMILPAWSAGAQLVQGLAGALELGGDLVIAVVAILGLGMLVAGVAGEASKSLEVWYVDDLARLLFAASLFLPIVVGIVLGVRGSMAGGARAIVVSLLSAGAAAGSLALTRRMDLSMWQRVRKGMNRLNMRPAFGVVGKGLHWMSSTMRGIGGILEGEGAMLWIFVIVLLIQLVVVGGSQ